MNSTKIVGNDGSDNLLISFFISVVMEIYALLT
jgi:hypothetical protein